MSGVSDSNDIREEHNGSFTCLTCGKNYKDKGNAFRHFQDAHTGNSEESFKCRYCGKGFGAKRYRNDHMKRSKCSVFK